MNRNPRSARRYYMRTVFSAALASLLATGAMAQDSADDGLPASKGYDITKVCGDKPVILGVADGFGGDSWRKLKNGEVASEAAKCPNIKQIYYTDASGDPQKANSDINSLVARGVNVLLVLPDLPAAQMPAMRQAVRAGVTVIPYLPKLDGKPGVDYTANVYINYPNVAYGSADWLSKVVKTGNIIYLGGPAGNPVSQVQFDAFLERMKAHPELKLLEDHYIVSNWSAADTQKAMAGLIAKYGQIDGVAADYAPVAYAAVRSFQEAGLKVPAIATAASNNEVNCAYLNDRKADKGWEYLTRDGGLSIVRFALRRGMAEYQGIESDEPHIMLFEPHADSTAGMDPKCDPLMPPDADLSSALTTEELNKVFGK